MKIVKVYKYVLGMPDFIHQFGDSEHHVYSGSLARHVAIEKVLYKIRQFLNNVGDATPGYKYINSFLTLLFGMNCSFPLKDIALYTAWCLGWMRAGIIQLKP